MRFPITTVNRRRRTGCAARHIDRHGKADADKEILVGRVDDARDDADHLAVAVEQRAARIAGVDRGVDLDQALQLLFRCWGLGRSGRNRRSPPRSSSCTGQRDCRRHRLHRPRAWHSGCPGSQVQDPRGPCWRAGRRYHFPAVWRRPGRARLGAVREGQLDFGRVFDDMQAGEDVAAVINHHPAPQGMDPFAIVARPMGLDQDQRGLDRLVNDRQNRRAAGWPRPSPGQSLR